MPPNRWHFSTTASRTILIIMASIPVFLLTPAPFAEQRLRRYSRGEDCPSPRRYHNASVKIGVGPYDPTGYSSINGPPSNEMRGDPRWPEHCDRCDYVFKQEDHWQEIHDQLYEGDPHGTLTTLVDAPVGAMWDATWLHDSGFTKRGTDGRCLIVRTPGGDWTIDGPSTQGGFWTRTGDIAALTVRPSILIGGYHAFMTNGVLEECLVELRRTLEFVLPEDVDEG